MKDRGLKDADNQVDGELGVPWLVERGDGHIVGGDAGELDITSDRH